ncbi:MAG TPA: hypothetical protein DDW76_38530 [Cyanobacteria bacterium UBA11369]|nr:hypothetical protein [Cyanobacteria bacterium UBA11371]HBE33707.1 hypothetical protein [Cyanobacteria bacterium UBA11368]HBE54492.1 hypothetical protein [Cyanobacteria bacterium UBA11369]
METLTPEQAAQIAIIVEKWRAIALSTEPIDRHKAASAIKAAYALMGKEVPEIVFCPSPRDALNKLFLSHLGQLAHKIEKQIVTKVVNKPGIIAKLKKQQRKLVIDYFQNPGNAIKDIDINQREIFEHIENSFVLEVDYFSSIAMVNLGYQLHNRIIYELYIQAKQQIKSKIAKLQSQLGERLWHSLKSELEQQNRQTINSNYHARTLLYDCCWLDICTSFLDCTANQSVREVLESLVKECGQICAYEKICFVCDRPRILSFDNQQRLHAEGAPAIQFADGFSVYAYHGVRLPEKYGKLHPDRWRSEWLLTEKNAELRRVLIQGIGYDRICQELEAIELDNWQEYTLLKIDNVEAEPMYILKMICPSTGRIHALRVPPDIESAREAIRWVNWGIDPEEFSVQT